MCRATRFIVFCAGLRQIHYHMIDLSARLQEVTGRLETLPGLDGDLAPRGGMLAALREPRLTKCQSDFGWSMMERSLALVPRHFSWDSEVFMETGLREYGESSVNPNPNTGGLYRDLCLEWIANILPAVSNVVCNNIICNVLQFSLA